MNHHFFLDNLLSFENQTFLKCTYFLLHFINISIHPLKVFLFCEYSKGSQAPPTKLWPSTSLQLTRTGSYKYRFWSEEFSNSPSSIFLITFLDHSSYSPATLNQPSSLWMQSLPSLELFAVSWSFHRAKQTHRSFWLIAFPIHLSLQLSLNIITSSFVSETQHLGLSSVAWIFRYGNSL